MLFTFWVILTQHESFCLHFEWFKHKVKVFVYILNDLNTSKSFCLHFEWFKHKVKVSVYILRDLNTKWKFLFIFWVIQTQSESFCLHFSSNYLNNRGMNKDILVMHVDNWNNIWPKPTWLVNYWKYSLYFEIPHFLHHFHWVYNPKLLSWIYRHFFNSYGTHNLSLVNID